MQGQGPSRRQIVIAETRHLLGKQIHPPLNQNNPSKLKVCYLLLRTSPTHLARNRISPFRLHVPGFSKGNFRSRWGTFLYFGTSSIFKGKNNILMLMENPIFYLKPLLEIRRTYLSIGIEGWGWGEVFQSCRRNWSKTMMCCLCVTRVGLWDVDWDAGFFSSNLLSLANCPVIWPAASARRNTPSKPHAGPSSSTARTCAPPVLPSAVGFPMMSI